MIALQHSYRNQEAADKTSAILSLVGTVNIPIIYKSVDWWYSLHQPATLKLSGPSSIDPSMAWPLITMILAFYVTYAWLLIDRTRLEILNRERKSRWVQAIMGLK